MSSTMGMTMEEARKILAVITEQYPAFRKDRNPGITLQLWHGVLHDKHYVDVMDALQEFYQTDTKGFPPTPGALREIVNRMEMWDEVSGPLTDCRLARRAILHGPEYAEEEFKILPHHVQAVIGTAENLRALTLLNKTQQEASVSKLTSRITAAYMQGGNAVFLTEPSKHRKGYLPEAETR